MWIFQDGEAMNRSRKAWMDKTGMNGAEVKIQENECSKKSLAVSVLFNPSYLNENVSIQTFQ